MSELVDITEETVTIPLAEFKLHMQKVDLCVGVLSGLMLAMGQNPMTAGFIPPDVRDRIAELGA